MSQPHYRLSLRSQHLAILIKALESYEATKAETFYVNEVLAEIKAAKPE